MTEFGILAAKIQKIDIYQILKEITQENDVQKWVKNTIKNRWQKTGIDAFGNKIQTDKARSGEAYADFTIILKEKYGSGIGGIDNHVTLTDSGDFWRNFRLFVSRVGFVTEGDFQKSDGNMYDNFTETYSNQNEFENAVTDLTVGELEKMINNFYYPKFENKLNAILS